ncbi:MAG TPA: CoA-transferase [Bacilli bacterium]
MLKESGQNNKLISLEEAAALVQDGDILALGGNVLHRSPSAFVRELARQGKKKLEVVKTAGAYDIDLLAAAGCLRAVSAGFVGYENEFGLCPHYRKRVEQGLVEAKEHACYTVITSLRAASYGVSFLPVNGLQGSDLPAQRGFRQVADPYTGETYVAIPKIEPDWAVIHVHEADKWGNSRIYGQKFEDVLMAKAAKRVIITAEKIIGSHSFEQQPERTDIPGFLVHAVVHSPKGALPASCPGLYPYDKNEIARFLQCREPREIAEYVAASAKKDRGLKTAFGERRW